MARGKQIEVRRHAICIRAEKQRGVEQERSGRGGARLSESQAIGVRSHQKRFQPMSPEKTYATSRRWMTVAVLNNGEVEKWRPLLQQSTDARGVCDALLPKANGKRKITRTPPSPAVTQSPVTRFLMQSCDPHPHTHTHRVWSSLQSLHHCRAPQCDLGRRAGVHMKPNSPCRVLTNQPSRPETAPAAAWPAPPSPAAGPSCWPGSRSQSRQSRCRRRPRASRAPPRKGRRSRRAASSCPTRTWLTTKKASSVRRTA